MDEQALRAVIRDALSRHLAVENQRTPGTPGTYGTHGTQGTHEIPAPVHASHARFNVLSGADLDGPCLIEPAVGCNHCGYCLSHGH